MLALDKVIEKLSIKCTFLSPRAPYVSKILEILGETYVSLLVTLLNLLQLTIELSKVFLK